jgi:hypothetical protein
MRAMREISRADLAWLFRHRPCEVSRKVEFMQVGAYQAGKNEQILMHLHRAPLA